MNDQEINIAIAEACGLIPSELIMFGDLHDYCNDLNAMHEAEKAMTNREKCDYINWLVLMLHTEAYPVLIHATARQRAEAFLRTIGKWKEDAK